MLLVLYDPLVKIAVLHCMWLLWRRGRRFAVVDEGSRNTARNFSRDLPISIPVVQRHVGRCEGFMFCVSSGVGIWSVSDKVSQASDHLIVLLAF
jgi:hypothetical protein